MFTSLLLSKSCNRYEVSWASLREILILCKKSLLDSQELDSIRFAQMLVHDLNSCLEIMNSLFSVNLL